MSGDGNMEQPGQQETGWALGERAADVAGGSGDKDRDGSP
jgi:hypothetical protein